MSVFIDKYLVVESQHTVTLKFFRFPFCFVSLTSRHLCVYMFWQLILVILVEFELTCSC